MTYLGALGRTIYFEWYIIPPTIRSLIVEPLNALKHDLLIGCHGRILLAPETCLSSGEIDSRQPIFSENPRPINNYHIDSQGDNPIVNG